MFNLLISGVRWPIQRASMPGGRVFEYTSEDLMAQFKPNGNLDTNAVCRLPTLFANETGVGTAARVGRITRVRAGYDFEYTLDADIPPISQARLSAMAMALDIDEWEFHRTHWAIKDVDLFEVLLKNGLAARPKPTVFDAEGDVQDDLVAVMMPFDAGFHPTYEALRTAAGLAGLQCQRADDIWINERIIQDVVTLISRARVVVCDLTGRNPNVFYEMGIAHSLGKQVVMVTQNPADVPFDVAHIRYIRYLANREGLATLTAEVAGRLQTLLTPP